MIVPVNAITHTVFGLNCLTETKIRILCDHVDHRRFHIVEMRCQIDQLLSAHIVGPTMFVNLKCRQRMCEGAYRASSNGSEKSI